MKHLYIKTFLALLFWAAFLTELPGQVFSMAKSTGDWVDDATVEIETDKNGNTYWLIDVNGSIKIGNRFSSGNFVNIKIDNSGNYVWFRQIDSKNTFKCFHMDSLGNSLIALKGSYPVEINSRTYTFGSEVTSILILQDSTGFVKFCSGIPAVIHSAKFDHAGNILLTGIIWEDARLGSVKLIRKPKDYNNYYDGFLAKMSTDGKVNWAFSFGCSKDVVPNDLAIDPGGTIYVCGSLPGKMTVNFGNLNHKTEASDKNAFMAAFTSKGETKWVKSPKSGSQASSAYKIKVDKTGRPVFLGKFSGKFLLDTFNFNQSFQHYFISKYNYTGEVLWARKITPIAAPYYTEPTGHDLDIDSHNNIYGGFTYNQSFAFDGIQFGGSHFASAAVLCLNDLGHGIWGRYISNPDANDIRTNNQINIINAQKHGRLLIGGDYSCKQTQLDQLTIYNNSGNSDNDAFIAEINYTPSSNCKPSDLHISSTTTNFCNLDTARLKINSSGLSRYTWLCNNETIAQNTNSIETSRPGEYKVIANDYSVCSETSNSIFLEQHSKPLIDIQAEKGGLLCPEESLTLVATTEPNTCNQWYFNDSSLNENSTVIKVDKPGIYQLYSRNEHCNYHQNYTVVQKLIPEVNLGADSLFCYNNSIQLGVEPVPGNSYFWYYNSYKNPFATTSLISTEKIGKYRIKAVNECGSAMDSILLVSSLIRTSSLKNNILQIFPNPFISQITITFIKPIIGEMNIQLCDLNGRIEYETIRQCDNENQLRLSLDSLEKGLYNLRLLLNNQEYLTKIIKL